MFLSRHCFCERNKILSFLNLETRGNLTNCNESILINAGVDLIFILIDSSGFVSRVSSVMSELKILVHPAASALSNGYL